MSEMIEMSGFGATDDEPIGDTIVNGLLGDEQ